MIYITRLISLDTSSSKTGWAIFENGKYSKSGLIDFDTKEARKKYKGDPDRRIADICLEIINLLRKYKPDIVVIEKLSVGRNMVSVRALCKVIGVVYCYSILSDCFYFEIQPSQWRSRLGMQKAGRKRDEYKELSMQYVKDNYGLDVTDDESDAICAGLGYIAIFTENMEE